MPVGWPETMTSLTGKTRSGSSWLLRPTPCPGQIGNGRCGEVQLQALEVAFHARQVRLGQQVLFALVILDHEEFRDGLCQEFLGYGLAIVRERKIDVEGQRVRPASQPTKDRLGFMELVIHQSSDGSADAGLTLELLDFEDLPLGFGLGTG